MVESTIRWSKSGSSVIAAKIRHPWGDVMDVNLKAAFFLSQKFAAAALAAKASAKIVNVASLLSFHGGIRVASYTASKSGLAGLTRLMVNEWAASGINVNAIAPGYVETNNTEALRTDKGRRSEILKRIPAGRWALASDMGGAAVFLASAASDYVHGTIIPVDGGWLARETFRLGRDGGRQGDSKPFGEEG